VCQQFEPDLHRIVFEQVILQYKNVLIIADQGLDVSILRRSGARVADRDMRCNGYNAALDVDGFGIALGVETLDDVVDVCCDIGSLRRTQSQHRDHI
jgi:hypothetical protein